MMNNIGNNTSTNEEDLLLNPNGLDSYTNYLNIADGSDYPKHNVSNIDTDLVSQSSASSLHDIVMPLKLRRLVKRLEDLEELTEDDILSILLIVRLGDSMLQAGYATFLTRSFVEELCQKLDQTDLDMELELAATRWTYQQGTVMTYHRLSYETDSHAMRALSRIALAVLEGKETVVEALHKIKIVENEEFTGFQKFYRNYPGNLITLPMVSSAGCILYFGGTLLDAGVCVITSIVAGFITYYCSLAPQTSNISDILIAIVAAIISTVSVLLFDGYVCFPAQVLGVVIWFVPGFDFVLSFYEISHNLVQTGTSRFVLATLKSYILAFGLVLGLWIAGYGGARYQDIASTCNVDQRFVVDHVYFPIFYTIVAAGKMMRLKVGPKQWLVCWLTQQVAANTQFVLATILEQPLFVCNFIPAFVATVAAHVIISFLNKRNLTQLAVESSAYFLKYVAREETKKETIDHGHRSSMKMRQSKRVLQFVDDRWDDETHQQGGYRRLRRQQYQRSDLWFCLAPALALLVPGANIWRVAFFSIVESSAQTNPNTEYSFEALISGLFVIGLGLVLGVRLGLTTLWLCAVVTSGRWHGSTVWSMPSRKH